MRFDTITKKPLKKQLKLGGHKTLETGVSIIAIMTVTRLLSPWMGLNRKDQNLISGQVMTTCQLRCQGPPCHHQLHDSDNDLPVTF